MGCIDKVHKKNKAVVTLSSIISLTRACILMRLARVANRSVLLVSSMHRFGNDTVQITATLAFPDSDGCNNNVYRIRKKYARRSGGRLNGCMSGGQKGV